jgi:hypothetical protein
MKVITAVVNNPIFIEIQYHTFKKYLTSGAGTGTSEAGTGTSGAGTSTSGAGTSEAGTSTSEAGTSEAGTSEAGTSEAGTCEAGAGTGTSYEFIVFNDAKSFPDFTNGGDITLRDKIIETCQRLGIKCINIPNEQHKNIKCSSVRVGDAMNFILKYQMANPDKYLLLDSDMFLIADLDIRRYFNYDCAVVLQSRNNILHYIWNGLYFMDFTKLQDLELLNWDQGHGGDTGGMMRDWFKKQTERVEGGVPLTDDLRWAAKEQTFHRGGIYYIKHLWSCSWNETELPETLKGESPDQLALRQFLKEDVRNVDGKFYCEIYDDVFLHYRAGGNWNKEGLIFHKGLSQKLWQALNLSN